MSSRKMVLTGLSALAVTLVLSGYSSAQEAATAAKPDTEEAAATAAKPNASGVRRDPRGVTGISPFWEAVIEGDRAYIARSYPAAVQAYKKAIAADPDNAIGHYRIGQAHVANGELREAEKAYEAALRYASSDPALEAKVLFVLADLRERQQDNSGAIERWDVYAQHTQQAEGSGYPATAVERKKVNAKWQEMKDKYAEVKERIAKREKEAEEKLKKRAK